MNFWPNFVRVAGILVADILYCGILTDGCILYYDQRRPFVSSSARRLKQVDSVARLGAIQVNPVETLQGETREVRAVEKALEVNDGIELNVVDSGVAGKSASAALLPSPACTKCSDILCFVFRLMLKGTLQINSNNVHSTLFKCAEC